MYFFSTQSLYLPATYRRKYSAVVAPAGTLLSNESKEFSSIREKYN